MLVALAVGAGTAGIAKVMSGPPVIDGSPDRIALDVPTSVSSPVPTAAPVKSAAGTVSGTSAVPTTATSSIAATTTTTAPMTTTTTTKKSKPTTDSSAASQVLSLVNGYRGQYGCGPVSMDSRLNRAAQGHSDDMSANGYFSHTSLDGRTFVDRAEDAGYPSPGAENIARGQTPAQQVMSAWMNSSGHRANILNCSMRTMGLGLATRGYYWTQMFGY